MTACCEMLWGKRWTLDYWYLCHPQKWCSFNLLLCGTVRVWTLTCSSFCSHTMTVWRIYTHSHAHSSPASNPWIYRVAFKIKFLLVIIFLVIRKYTCSQRGMHRRHGGLAVAHFPSSVSSCSLLHCLCSFFSSSLFFCSFTYELFYALQHLVGKPNKLKATG